MRRLLFALLLFATPIFAAEYPAPVEHDFVVHDFHFESGETLPELKIHYATIGDAKNPAVLILHGTGGSLHQFLNDHYAGVLFVPGGILDARRYFIVFPDNIGHGKSTKPSDGLGEKFPHYDYADMTELQHRLITEGLGIKHLFLVTGTSMGGMQTWMWGERWPRMMDGLVPLASAPVQIAGRNRVWRDMMMASLRAGHHDDAMHILLLVGSAPLAWQKDAPTRDAADRFFAAGVERLKSINDEDMLYALAASRDYDPSPRLEEIVAPLLAINSTDDFINPPELGILDREIKRVKHGRYVLIQASENTHGHGTHTWPAIWGKYLRDFVARIKS